MTCGGRTYVVNEDDGFCNGRKVRRYRDTSFRSIVGFMLLILLFWVLVSCIIFGIQKSKEKQRNVSAPSSSRQEGLHNDKHLGEEPLTTTPNPVITVKKYDEDKNGLQFVPTVKPEERNKSSVSTPTTTPIYDDKYSNKTLERDKSAASYAGNNYNTTEKNIEREHNVSTTVASVQATLAYNKTFTERPGYETADNKTAAGPKNATEYQGNDNDAVTENIIKKEHHFNNKHFVKETDNSAIPVTETFIKKTAYTVGQNERPVTNKILTEVTTIGKREQDDNETNDSTKSYAMTDPTITDDKNEQVARKQNTSENSSAIETTSQANLLTTISDKIDEQVFSNSNSSTGQLDVNTTTAQQSSAIEITTSQERYETTVSDKINEELSSNSNSSKGQLDITTITAQNSSAIEITTQANILTTISDKINEELSSNSNSSKGQLDITTITAQNSSAIEITTQANILTTISDKINEELSSNSNSSKGQLDITTITAQNSSAIEITTQANILTTISDKINEELSSNSNSSKGQLNITTITAQNSSAIEITTQANILTTISDKINEELSSNSNSSKGQLDITTITAQNSSAIEITTQANILTTISDKINEELSSNSNSSKRQLDITTVRAQISSAIEITTTQATQTTISDKINEAVYSNSNSSKGQLDITTVRAQNSSAIEITTTQANILTTISDKINEQVSSKSNSAQRPIDIDNAATQNSSLLEITTSADLAIKQSNTNKDPIDISTESYQTETVFEITTKETGIVEGPDSGSSITQNTLDITTEAVISKPDGDIPSKVQTTSDIVISNTEYSAATTMKSVIKPEHQTINNMISTTEDNRGINENKHNYITTQETILVKNKTLYHPSSHKSEVTTITNKFITTTGTKATEAPLNVKPTEVTTIQNDLIKHSSREEPVITIKTQRREENPTTIKSETQGTTTEIPDFLEPTSTQLTPVFKEPPIKNETKEVKTCSTSNCRMKSSEILRLMDYQTEPCENFYQFSCGDYQNNDKNTLVEVLLEAYYTGKIPKNPKYLSSFFDKCLEYEETTSLTDKIDKVRNINMRKDDLTQLLRLLIVRQSTPFFDIRLGPLNNKDPYTIQILPPSSGYHKVGLKNWSIKKHIEQHCYQSCMSYQYKKEIDMNEVHNEYKTCQRNTFKKIAEHFFTTYNTSVSDKDGFLSFFLDIMFDTSNLDIQQEMLSKNYRKMTVDELSKKYDAISDWIGLFKNISYGRLNENTSVYVLMEDQYFKPLMDRLKNRMKTNPNFVNHLVTYFQLELGEYLLNPIEDRNRFCMEQTVELMPELANYVFIQYSKLGEPNMRIFEELLEDIKTQYYWIIDQSELEEENKILLKNELDILKLLDFTDLKKDTANFDAIMDTINLSEDHLSAVLMLIENRRQISYSLPAPIDTYFLYYLLNNAFDAKPKYIPYSKKIVIPNAYVYDIVKMQKNKIPRYIYTTKIKFHLSRAVALYLDEVLTDVQSPFYKQFGKNLDYNLQSDEAVVQLHDQKIKYKANNEATWEKVLNLSLRNRIADNLALKVAFTSTFSQIADKLNPLPWLSDSYTTEKQYFLLVAQEYCKKADIGEMSQSLYETSALTPALRIETMMIHSKDFDDQFKCKPGTPMNPEIDKTQFDSFAPEEYEYQS